MRRGCYDDVDLEGFLDHYNIEYRTSGKNIGSNWMSICCPFCQEERFHCGIHLDSKTFSCWVCGETGTFLKLAATLLNTSWKETGKQIKPFQSHFVEHAPLELAKEVIFPTRMTKLTRNGRKYLSNRGFNPKELIEKYNLMETGMLSKLKIDNKSWDFKNRIIVPIIMGNIVASYTARDWTEASSTRYKNAPTEAGTAPLTKCLYNIDNAKGSSVILVEGPTDVWRIGDNCIAMMGVKFSTEQIKRLVERRFKKIVILFDAEAEKTARKLAVTLHPFINDISVFTLQEGDPGSLSIGESTKVKFQLLGGSL